MKKIVNRWQASVILLSLGLLTVCNLGFAKVHKYKSTESSFEGLFLPAPKINAPGIVLIHNWMGVTSETEKQAIRFQKLGYNVLAADIYGEGIRPKNPQEAGVLATKYKNNRKLLRERVKLAIDELKKQVGVDSKSIAVIGFCFGGTVAIEVARSGEDIKGVITFHGGLDSPNPEVDGPKIKTKMLILHGAIDPFVSSKDLEAFEKEMQTFKVDYELVKYGGAVHSFTDETSGTDISKGAAYNSSVDIKSFARARSFLTEVFHY
jgi:dienelactone hydrolase